MPDFENFRKSIEGKPLGRDFLVDRTERPLGRPRNADLIRNTASYAA